MKRGPSYWLDTPTPSGERRALGKGEVESSILSGSTSRKRRITWGPEVKGQASEGAWAGTKNVETDTEPLPKHRENVGRRDEGPDER
jgi:hypothetical protein